MFSLASIATMSACIFLFGLFFSIVTNFQAMVKEAESGVAVTVFFDEGITQEKIDHIGDEIKKRPEVSSYEFKSAEQAWEEFKVDYSYHAQLLCRKNIQPGENNGFPRFPAALYHPAAPAGSTVSGGRRLRLSL